MTDLVSNQKEYKIGMMCALGSAILWGVLPIYWQALRPIDSVVIIFYRIVLVGIVCFVVALKVYGIREIIAPLAEPKVVLKLFLAGVVVTCNWSMYIYMVNHDYVIQTCIGYYIEPLMVCVFGMIFFHERPTRSKFVALGFALLGVTIVLIHFRQLPVLALALAITFATYTAIKKHLNIKALVSLFYETVFLIPVALGVILYFEKTGTGAFSTGAPHQIALLMLAGILTALPLGMFSIAANRISLISLGIVNYISPSLTLVIGIFIFKETFDLVQFIAFVVIWVGLVIFTGGEFFASRRALPKKAGAE